MGRPAEIKIARQSQDLFFTGKNSLGLDSTYICISPVQRNAIEATCSIERTPNNETTSQIHTAAAKSCKLFGTAVSPMGVVQRLTGSSCTYSQRKTLSAH